MLFSVFFFDWLLGAFALTAGLIMLMLKLNFGRFLLDIPTERSLHTRPIPRLGGIAIVATIVGLLTIELSHGSSVITPCLAFLAALSFLDDRHNLPVLIRLAVHVAAALVFVGHLFLYFVAAEGPDSVTFYALGSVAGVTLLIFFIVWMTNLYNFMDGANGLAGGMAVIGFMAYSIAASMAAAIFVAFIAMVASGAALGFLCFNFHTPRVFMGDAGSIPLGFLAAALGILGNLLVWPLWFPLLVFSPFIVDATVTLIKRCFQGEKIWLPHREHYYQRLVLSGWSHKKLALVEYALMLACGGSAVYALGAEQPFLGSVVTVQQSILVFWCVAYPAFIVVLEIYLNRSCAKIKTLTQL